MIIHNNFNTKWKDYLQEGHYGLDIYNREVEEYLNKVFIELTKIPNFKFQQIKLKFGMARFYTNLDECLGSELSMLIERGVENKIDSIINKQKK